MSQPLHNRAVIAISPASPDQDVPAFLQGLVTNDVMQASTGRLVYAGLLTPQGKTLFDFFVWPASFDNGPGFLIDCEKELAEELVKRLSLYRLRRKIEIAPASELVVYWSAEPKDGYFPDPRLPALGFRKIAIAGESDHPADEQYLAHRLSLGVAEGRAELGDVLWLETNAGDLNGVSFSKGCYIGQENTARMNWRGKINRRLVVVPIELSQPDRCKASYPGLGLAVDHLRVDDIAESVKPAWMVLASEDGE